MNIYVIIPAFNEYETIHQVVKNINEAGYEVIVVDDGSTLPLDPYLKGLSLHLLRHKINLGQGAALQTGIEYAVAKNADYIITFDADGQHQASDIISLIRPLKEGQCDITLGSRFIKDASHNMNKTRRIILLLARMFNAITTGLLLTDAHNGLRAFTRKAAAEIEIKQNGMAHATELLQIIKEKKLHFTEVPVNVIYTDYSYRKGQSIWNSFRIVFDLFLNKIFK
jgi:glycosyltransferase involved in cell wall biosynthesis